MRWSPCESQVAGIQNPHGTVHGSFYGAPDGYRDAVSAGKPRGGATRTDPEDPRKPKSPTELTRPSMMYVLRKTAREFARDQCTDLAAALTYYAVLSLFPALVVMVSLLGVFGQGK